MAITDSQKTDLLFKKVGYGVAKTDISTNKSPANEGNASPLVSPGSTIYQQDYLISSTTVLPSSNSSVVSVYRDSLTSTVQCTKLPTTSANVSWSTGLTDWVPVQYGTGYQVKLYAGPSGSSTPQNYISLPADGSGNNDSWYFDYQSGIVNFADTNVPTAANQNGNVVYVVGARYTGIKGISTFGNLQIGNISISGNTISGNTNVTISGNIYGNIVGNVYGAQTNITSVGTLGNLTVSGNVSATYFLGNAAYLTGIPTAYSDANVAAYLPTYTGNLSPGNITSTFYGNVNTNYINSQSGSVVSFVNTGALKLPTGDNNARPSSNVAGYIRYNTSIGTVEYYTGSGWTSVNSSVDDEVLTGDNSTTVFTLKNSTTTNAILVSINGTLQLPGVAYSVNNNQITFAEAPLSTDTIDVRYLAALVALDTERISKANVLVGTANTIIDSWSISQVRSAKYTISSLNNYDAQMAEVMVLQNNGVVVINTFGVLNTGANIISFYANISGSTVNLLANASNAGNQLRIKTVYFDQ